MIYSILDFGARADGTVCTSSIQSAIDAAFRDGGGTVEVPAGTFLTGGVRLRSRVTLLLRSGSVLKGTRNPLDYEYHLTDPIEPIAETLARTVCRAPASQQPGFDYEHEVTRRWTNGLIRLIGADEAAILGEPGSVIDGSDCYDETNEEHYRGPHAISAHLCRNLRFEGYTVRNSANWAHAVFDSQNITLENIEVLAGHDGAHFTNCDNVTLHHCAFYTGDDCIAGIDLCNVTVTDCVCNTACSAFRLGGTNVRIAHCHLYGPAKYLFRGSLSKEEKAASAPSAENTDGRETDALGHRYNMLSAFTYYADFTRAIREQPGNIVLSDCKIEHTDRLLHYNYSGNETWQKNRPLQSLTFENVEASGISMPLTAYGDPEVPLSLTFRNCSVAFRADASLRADVAFMHLCHFDRVLLDHVSVDNPGTSPLVKTWSDNGELTMRDCTFTGSSAVVAADEPFFARAI